MSRPFWSQLTSTCVFISSLSLPVPTPKSPWPCLSSTARWPRNTWKCKQRLPCWSRESESSCTKLPNFCCWAYFTLRKGLFWCCCHSVCFWLHHNPGKCVLLSPPRKLCFWSSLFACQQNYRKTTCLIFIKLCGSVKLGPTLKQIHKLFFTLTIIQRNGIRPWNNK